MTAVAFEVLDEQDTPVLRTSRAEMAAHVARTTALVLQEPVHVRVLQDGRTVRYVGFLPPGREREYPVEWFLLQMTLENGKEELCESLRNLSLRPYPLDPVR